MANKYNEKGCTCECYLEPKTKSALLVKSHITDRSKAHSTDFANKTHREIERALLSVLDKLVSSLRLSLWIGDDGDQDRGDPVEQSGEPGGQWRRRGLGVPLPRQEAQGPAL
jgi:hypothetical protein